VTEVVETTINGRWTLRLPKHRADRPSWPWWEATRLAHMHHLLGRGGHVVYDVGSEEGDFPALWTRWGNRVVLFEANDRVWPNIAAIWDANDLDPPLTCFPGFAADSDSDEITIPVGWPESVTGPVIPDHGFLNLAERDDVQRITIDSMAQLVDPPSAITIDVEGAELVVLHGAKDVLSTCRPLVWVSVHEAFMADMYGHTPADLDGYLRGLDYEPTFLCTDHERHEFWSPLERALGPR
jgi:FkbM family methyltransferase